MPILRFPSFAFAFAKLKMTTANNLDLHDDLKKHPLAELLTEIAQTRLDGTLRVARENQKIIIYFRSGEIVFAVSNARSARLFDFLLRENKISKNALAEHPSFANDLEFAKSLVEKKVFTQAEIDEILVRQIEDVLREAIEWKTGEWIFSPLVKIREGINYHINFSKININYARTLSGEAAFRRFRSSQEVFAAAPTSVVNADLQAHEGFVLSRFNNSQLKIEEIRKLCNLPDAVVFQTLYVLWLGGFLRRYGWNSAFTEHRVNTILSARLALKKAAVQISPSAAESETESAPEKTNLPETKTETVATPPISLEEFLTRTENAENLYESLAVDAKATPAEIKQTYFSLAKQFHPDRFYKQSDAEQHRRIQRAFTQIAQAYETLKNEETRRAYDFKAQKELSQKAKMRSASVDEITKQNQIDAATENFDRGFELLEEDCYAQAAPFLARAVHLAPGVARYHAYYGKVLSIDEKQRFKAEAELQTAIKIETHNPTFRLMLVDFFLRHNLLKRAEGELKRMLVIFPRNTEAQSLLDSLQRK